jgi:hypothetical protein
VILRPLVSPRCARGDEAAVLAAERADNDHFLAIKEPVYQVADFAFAIGPAAEYRPVEYAGDILKIDTVDTQVDPALLLVPLEHANAFEWIVPFGVDHGGFPRQETN